MATDREIGDLVARFRLIVEDDGVKDATLTLDRLEKRASARAGTAGQTAGSAFSGAFSGALVGQGISTALTLLDRALTASIGAFLKAGAAGELDGKAQQTYIELDNAISEATVAVQELAVAFGEDLAPAVEEVSQIASGLTEPLAGAMKVVIGPGLIAANLLNKVTGEADESVGAAKRNAKAAEAYAKAQEGVNKVLAESEKRFRALIDAQIDELESGLRVEGAVLSRADAEAALADAQEAVAAASTRGAEFSRREADALDAVRDAQDAVADARFRAMRAADDLGEAQLALVEAEFRFGPQSKEAGEASDDLQEAQQALTEANRDVTESGEDVASRQRDYEEALRDGIPTVEAAEEAQRNLAKAELGVKQALLDQAQANTAHYETTLRAAGVTLTAAQNAKLEEDNLRALAAYASSPEFAAAMLAGANAIGGIRAGSSLAGSDGGRSFQGAVDQAVGATIYQTNQFFGLTDPQLIAQIGIETDWAARQVTGGAVTFKQ